MQPFVSNVLDPFYSEFLSAVVFSVVVLFPLAIVVSPFLLVYRQYIIWTRDDKEEKSVRVRMLTTNKSVTLDDPPLQD